MKKILLVLAFAVLQFINAQAQSPIWQKCYGGSNDDSITGMPIATSDGGFILTCSTNSNNGTVSGNHCATNSWIIKTNNVGAIQWQKCYGGTGDDEVNSIIPTADGGYILTGSTNSNVGDVSVNHSTSSDGWIIKINALGTILRQKCLGGDSNEYLSNIIPTSDGGYVACGNADTINNGDVLGNTNFGGWVIKINNLGIILWQKVYDNRAFRHFSSILQTADEGYVLCGNFEN